MDETAEDLRNWRAIVIKLRCSRPTRAKYHHASKKPGRRSSFDPESYSKLPPITTMKLRQSETALYASKPWRIV